MGDVLTDVTVPQAAERNLYTGTEDRRRIGVQK